MPDDLTAKLDALKALCAAATPDMCVGTGSPEDMYCGATDVLGIDPQYGQVLVAHANQYRNGLTDARFFAASRTALPPMIDCLQAADALYMALREFKAIGPAQYACYEAARAKLAAALEGGK